MMKLVKNFLWAVSLSATLALTGIANTQGNWQEKKDRETVKEKPKQDDKNERDNNRKDDKKDEGKKNDERKKP